MKEVHPFVQRLYDLAERDDRAALAELRRAWVNPLAGLAYVAPFLRREATRREEEALSLIGALFALHPARGSLSLAEALRVVAQKSDSVALRFRALLDADGEDLPVHLRHAVTLARSHDLAVDYDDLLSTVRWWGDEQRKRQRAWARDFWANNDTAEENTP